MAAFTRSPDKEDKDEDLEDKDEEEDEDDDEECLLRTAEDSEGEEGREEVRLEFDPDFLLSGESFRR